MNARPRSRPARCPRRVVLALVAEVMLVAACGADPAPPPPPPVVPAAPPPVVERPVDDSATLDITSIPESDVLVDGKPAGRTPIKAYKVNAGRHDVTFVDPERGNQTLQVDVAPGESREVSLHLAPPPADESLKPADEAKKKKK